MRNKINTYLEEKIYNYALLVDGKWGTGKTYNIKKYIENKKEKKKIIYLSLYKIESVKDLENRIYEQIFKNDELENNKIKSNNEVFNGFKNFLSEITKDIVESKVGINIDTSINNLKEFHRSCVNFNNYVFCFDDLERTTCNISKILGFLSDLINEWDCKVILIGNEEELDKKNMGKYRKNKEKVIGRTILFSNDIKNVQESLLENIMKVEEVRFKEIIKRIEIDENKNLRTYQYFIYKSYSLYCHIQKARLLDTCKDRVLEETYHEILKEIYNEILEEREGKEHKERFFKSLDDYLVEEYIDEKKFKNEVENLKENLSINQVDGGIISKLKNSLDEYNNDEEIENDLKKVLENVCNGIYSINVFPEILFAILNAESIGFEKLNIFQKASTEMIEIIKNSTKKNIENSIYAGFIYDYIKNINQYDKERAKFIKNKFKKIEEKIQDTLNEKGMSKITRMKLLGLKNRKMDEQVLKYIEMKRKGEKVIFDIEEINEVLVEEIQKMEAKEIHKFREIFIGNIEIRDNQIMECKKLFEMLKRVNIKEFSCVKKYAWNLMLVNIEECI